MERRGDAFEHDLQVSALRPAFAAAGLELVELDWHAPLADFDGIELALLGTAWDYQDHAAAFLARLKELEEYGITVCNSSNIVRWNLDKGYLRELGEAGLPTIPTLWHGDVGQSEVLAGFDHFATDKVVVKRQVGAGGMGQHSFTRESLPDADWSMGHASMIQPFLPSIVEEGEFTLVFIDGEFSHGVRKRAAQGEYRIQSLYGGTEEDYAPSSQDLASAQSVVDTLPFPDWLYARIDMVRLPSGTLAVMEAELIEPYLYPQQGPELGTRLARAITDRT
ncbi:ATP-grasp domain-containing protein [Erythrobacter sp. W53]|uniref:ATP-grasp domain-containing protein n=1 Tax=Erythrobacter sp. W53 TaxID=3425947 RepID=UPI003D76674F